MRRCTVCEKPTNGFIWNYTWVRDDAQIQGWLRAAFPDATLTDAMNFNPHRRER